MLRDARRCAAAGLDPAGGRAPWGAAVLSPEGRVLLDTYARNYSEAARLVAGAAGGVECVVLAVDAPLRLIPRGLRSVERLLQRCVGVPLLPHGLPGMRRLHEHALRSIEEIRARLGADLFVVETYPAAASKIVGVPRPRGICRHVSDARLAAAAAWCHSQSCGLAFWDRRDTIVLPTPLLPARLLRWLRAPCEGPARNS